MIILYCWEERVISGCRAKDVRGEREQSISSAGTEDKKGVTCTREEAVPVRGHSALTPKLAGTSSVAQAVISCREVLELFLQLAGAGRAVVRCFQVSWKREPGKALLQGLVLWYWSWHGLRGKEKKEQPSEMCLVSSSRPDFVCDQELQVEGRGAGRMPGWSQRTWHKNCRSYIWPWQEQRGEGESGAIRRGQSTADQYDRQNQAYRLAATSSSLEALTGTGVMREGVPEAGTGRRSAPAATTQLLETAGREHWVLWGGFTLGSLEVAQYALSWDKVFSTDNDILFNPSSFLHRRNKSCMEMLARSVEWS